MPNTTSAPTRSSAYTSAWAPVALILPGLVTCACGSDGAVPASGAGTAGAAGTGAVLAGEGAGCGWSAGRAAGWCGERAARSRGLGPGGRAAAAAGRSVPAGPVRPVICSVIGKSPSLGFGGISGIKNPPVPDGSRGERAASCLVSCLRAGQVREAAGVSRVPPYCCSESRRQPVREVVSHAETGRLTRPVGRIVGGPHQGLHSGGAHRPGHQESLAVAAAHLAQRDELAGLLDALGDDPQAEV